MASLHARPASPEAPAAPWRPPGLLRALFWGALAPLLVALVWGCGGSEGGSDGGLDAALDAALDAGPPPDARPAPAPLRQWVDPRIGSGGVGFGYGACSPAAQTPYGMVRPGPNTAMPEGPAAGHHFSGYHADDSLLEGFGQLRSHGMGAVDYGVLAVMPTDAITPERTNKLGYRSAFTQSTEIASPGYYAVTLDDTGIRAEISATDHVGVHRFTFPPGSPQVLLLDASHALTTVQILDASVQIDAAAQEIHGSVLFDGAYSGRRGGMRAYYVARFDRPFQDQGVWDAGALLGAETSRTGTEVGAYVHLDPAGGESVQLAIGISWTDLDHARANLDAEMPIPDLDAARAAAEDEWEGLLSRIEISARTEREFTIFYTALYHSLIMPSLASDVDGSYRGLDRAVHVASGFSYYTDFSLWDTYRTLHPLLTLVYPELQRDFLKSLIAMAGDGGYMPRWPLGYGYSGGMVGESATIVFADSVARGLDGFDLRAAY
ncbi:MAG: glycoside hydrolase family 92 protein, partial [Myxococcales bacterium]|nr:glycoside hydrolase family 92 protein [Myxococcales bacterium]